MPSIKRLDTQEPGFDQALADLLSWESVADTGVRDAVEAILAAVRAEGDAAVLRYTAKFDRLERGSVTDLEIPPERLQAALESLPEQQRTALETAAARIRRYAEHQLMRDWDFVDEDGTLLGQRVTPLDSVGLYVPGGKAAYPSSPVRLGLGSPRPSPRRTWPSRRLRF